MNDIESMFGKTITVDGNTLIPLISVGLGFGVGAGEGTDPKKGAGHGGGTGGGGGVKPIALIINKEGVRVEPVKVAAAHLHQFRLRMRLGLGDPADTGLLWAVVGPLNALAQGMPNSYHTESLRCGALVRHGAVTLLPIEHVILHAYPVNGHAWFSVTKEPYTVVVPDTGGMWTIGSDAASASLKRLRQSVPGLGRVLALM